MSAVTISRLIDEWKAWRKSHPRNFVAKLNKNPDGTLNLLEWNCQIPVSESQSDGRYNLTLKFNSDYPITPPDCKFPLFDAYLNRYFCWRILDPNRMYNADLSITNILYDIFLECPYRAAQFNVDPASVFGDRNYSPLIVIRDRYSVECVKYLHQRQGLIEKKN